MGVRKPHAVTDIRASCEIHSSAALDLLSFTRRTLGVRAELFRFIRSSPL